VGYPDEGASNEVSSLANEKFISSRNKYGAKGKQYLLAGSPTRHSGVLGYAKNTGGSTSIKSGQWKVYQYKN